MTKVKCMVIDDHSFYNGELTLDEEGNTKTVAVICGEAKGAPGQVFYTCEERLFFYVVKDEAGNYLTPKFYQPDNQSYHLGWNEPIGTLLNQEEKALFCGCCNAETGAVVVAPLYDFVYMRSAVNLNKETAVVSKAGQLGIIDALGNVRLSFKYDSLRQVGTVVVAEKSGYYGLFSQTGQEMIPMIYEELELWDTHYNYGFIKVRKNQKVGLVNLRNDVILDSIYDDLKSGCSRGDRGGSHDSQPQLADQTLPFGLLLAQKEGKWGMVDESGEVRINFDYDEIRDYHWQWNRAIVRKGSYDQIVDFSGKVLLKGRCWEIRHCFAYNDR